MRIIHPASAFVALAALAVARAEPQLATTTPTRNVTFPTARTSTFRSTDTVLPTTTRTLIETRFAEGTRAADISYAAERRTNAAEARAQGLLAAAIAPIVVLSIVFGPCVYIALLQYERHTRKIIADARAADVNRPWGDDVELAPKEPEQPEPYVTPYASPAPVPRGALVAVSVPLLATPAAAAPAAVSTTVTTAFRSAESFFADKYAPQREAAERTIRNCTIAAPILAVAPFLISAVAFGILYVRRRRALAFAKPKVEYWGIN
ncbi:uncharacterized protein LOC62_05G007251 [Vanrija pseudolonga]|uniref:Mid2 domain-containing protein n=1 Tax=Vanrija pseudolonga TaxID=143232 RepID=A0AAF1BMS8_9TREE|nr:hypothetical protein LOC62_05G007251 [Vanrija pseudolonga]